MFENIFFKKVTKDNNKENNNPKKTGILSSIRNLNSKNLILTLALVSSLGGVAKAKEVGKTIETKGFRSEVIDSADKVEFQAVNYFASDSDYISPEAKQKIGEDFKLLLDQVNEGNYRQIIKDGIYVYSSADPEKTNNFENNELLARARAESLIKILKEYLGSVNLSNLSAEKTKEFVENIQFFVEIPTSSNVSSPQVGVTYPEDLGYSTRSVAEMSPEEINGIYAQCRKVVVSLGVYKNDTYYLKAKDFINPLPSKQILNEKETNVDGQMKWNADNIVILVDNSPSVGENSYKKILEKIANDPGLINKKIQFSFFSKNLGETVVCNNINEVLDIIEKEKFQGNNVEHAFSSSFAKINSIGESDNNESSTVMATFTDENLQDISLKMVNDFEFQSFKKNVDAKFYFVDKESGLMQIKISEIKSVVEKKMFEDIKDVVGKYIVNKRRELMYSEKKDKDIVQKQLNTLMASYKSENLNEILNNPLLDEIYGYKNAKDWLINKNIPSVSLKNVGSRASMSDGNFVYNQE